jgi:iron complex transport system ATP-binding protein
MSTLTLEDVAVRYNKRGVSALAGYSDVILPGEWLGLIGPNGAGKSSLLKAIAGLVRSDGCLAVDGVVLADLNDRSRAALVAYVAQDPLIPNDMTTREYVLLGRTPYIGYFGSPTRADHRVVDDVLERLRLGEFANRLLGELSGGERQRIVLARALAQQAPILLLDEPTSALDIGHQQQALELVAELRRSEQLTIISALHDLTLAGTYTDRLVMLHHGDVVASGDAADVLTADRLGQIYNVCVTVDVDIDELGNRQVVVVPRRGFPAP